eukprot:TCONS_00072002-protein
MRYYVLPSNLKYFLLLSIFILVVANLLILSRLDSLKNDLLSNLFETTKEPEPDRATLEMLENKPEFERPYKESYQTKKSFEDKLLQYISFRAKEKQQNLHVQINTNTYVHEKAKKIFKIKKNQTSMELTSDTSTEPETIILRSTESQKRAQNPTSASHETRQRPQTTGPVPSESAESAESDSNGSTKIKFLQGAIMDKWLDTCMNMTTWNNRWFPLFPKIPQESIIVQQLNDPNLIMGSLLRRVYGFMRVNLSGEYHFQLKTHEGAEVLLEDTGMTMQNFTDDFSDLEKLRNWKELMYINVTLKQMQEQNIFQRGVLIHYKSPIQKVYLKCDQVYHIEILQGGRFYSDYHLKWKKATDKGELRKIDKDSLFHTHSTNSRSLPSLLWHKNPPRERYSYSREEKQRLDFYKHKTLDISNILRLSENLKCPKTEWYKRNITQLYLGRIFVDYQLVYPKNFLEYKGGWPLNHLLLNE